MDVNINETIKQYCHGISNNMDFQDTKNSIDSYREYRDKRTCIYTNNSVEMY